MKAIHFPAKDTVLFGDRPDPRPGPGEVLVAVRASGLCHTDIEVMRGNYGSSAFPVVPGHEYAGVVTDIGAGVTDIAAGDRVVVDPNIECGDCRACRRGWAHLCDRLGAYGVTVDGGFAAQSVVRASAVYPIGDLPFGRAALAEPMACVLNGIDALGVTMAETALIFGAGPMGVLMALALRSRGVTQVVMVDLDDSRLELADSFRLGAVAAGSAALEGWRHGADLAVDATGVPAVAAGLPDYLAPGGGGLFFGVCPASARIEISPFDIFRRQLRLVGSHSLNHNIPAALDAISAIGPDLDRVISHSLPLDAVADIFASHAPKGSLKIQAVAD
ncbi:zinc-dependent alcohol dehydrogenase family protein [Meridianimarinicoccus sp. RP-17]|uniref:zinc-dependent alcohol dehydrogenase family protein n=1 Tax=Meridianimarinicoccus zhengii TaxID=2056810 RepID=UPI000DAC1E75|nr:zinc-dependent alcohol dehydrogenase family protein [Phycocomes zhengii]